MPRPVYLTLKSADVCHSFWVPRLAGKTDLIPGRTNYMWFQTDKPGLYRRPVRRVLRHAARQHAHPRRRRFARATSSAGWRTSGSRPWSDPDGQRGQGGVPRAVVRQLSPGARHVRPRGSYAPDLTHLMSRETLAAGMVAEHAREPAPLGRRPAADQAGLPDAGVRPERPRARPHRPTICMTLR